MDAEDARPSDRGGRSRPRRPSPVERRERRSQVEDPAEVLDAAARFLEARQRSVAEVRRKLTGLGYRAPLVDDAVTRLEALGYLDDEAFARAWVASRDRARPRGEYALRRELQLKGVASDVIASVLGERAENAHAAPGEASTGIADGRATADADQEAAQRLLGRRSASLLREPDLRRRRSKAYALLARNGFAPDVCTSVVGAWIADEDPGTGS